MDRKRKIHLWYFFVAIWGVLLLQNLLTRFREVQQIPYSQFQTYLEGGQVEEISITDTHIQGTFTAKEWGGAYWQS